MTQPRKSELTRQTILTTGRRLVIQGGFGAMGLSALLKESGVPKGSFYYYFPSKEAFGQA
ncbi:MAG: TetR/AcrR family transcriptional regulator, partial [Maritimibacter sp.]